MTFLRGILKASENVYYVKRCVVFCKNNWTEENFFGTKIEIPSPPKRPLSAYMLFIKEKRKDVLKDNPLLKNTEQIRVLAEKWKHLTEDLKQYYEVSAREGKQLYGEEHKRFYESLTEEQKEELTRLKAKKLEQRRMLRNKKTLRDSDLPKAPNSAYTFFVQSEAKKKPSVKHPTEFIKKVAESWKLLPEDSKKTFERQAEEDKRRYAGEMKEWRKKMMTEDNKKIKKAYEELKGKVLELEKEKKAPRKKSSKAADEESPKIKQEESPQRLQ